MKLKTLKAIHFLVKKLKIPDSRPTGTTKTQKFIEFLEDPELVTDDELSMKLYGSTGLDEYRTLKKRVKSKVRDQFFQLNISENDQIEPRKKLLFENSSNMHAVKTLLMMGERDAAIELAEEALKPAITHQHFDGVVYFSSEIRYHCSITGDKKGYRKHDNILNEYQQKQEATFTAEHHALSFQMEFMRGRHRKPLLSKMAHEKADEIKLLFNKHQTFDIGRTYFRLRNQAFQNEANYKESNKVLDQWLSFLEENKKLSWNSLFAEIYLNKINNALQMSDYREGHGNIVLCSKYLPEVNYNWFVMKDLEFLLYMHESKFKEAYKLVENILSMNSFTTLTLVRQEKWNIYHVYATFAMNFIAGEKTIKAESIKKLDNELAFFNNDKKGMYINILILHALKSLITKDDFYLDEKQKALEQYYLRHLKNESSSRSKIFMQMLISVTNINDENRKKVIRGIQKQYKKLQNVSSIAGSGKEMQEIIPYEVICGWMLRQLQTNRQLL